MKYNLSLGSILSGEGMQDFLELLDEAACEWYGLEPTEMSEAADLTVTFELPD